uniref:WAP domain-containing protein n=1 Tax=Parascaris univalens TaxID=6257 RepID=A0A915B2D4_PARUN
SFHWQSSQDSLSNENFIIIREAPYEFIVAVSLIEKMKEIHIEFIITIFALVIRLKPSQVVANNAILSGPHQRKVVCWRLIDRCNLNGTRNATKCDELGSLCFDRTKICVVMEEFCHDAISDRKRCDEGVKKCCENIVTQISSDL